MLKEILDVTHKLEIGGKVVETVKSGYHFESIAPTLAKLYEKHRDACEKAYAKYFGPEVEIAKASVGLEAVAKKPEQERTDEDRKTIEAFKQMQAKTFNAYVEDPETPRVVSVWETPHGSEIILDADLKGLAETTMAVYTNRDATVNGILRHAMFDVMRKTNVKLIVVAMKFEDDEDGKKRNHSSFAFGSPFRDFDQHDIDVLDNVLEETRRRTLSDMRRSAGGVITPEKKLIVP